MVMMNNNKKSQRRRQKWYTAVFLLTLIGAWLPNIVWAQCCVCTYGDTVSSPELCFNTNMDQVTCMKKYTIHGQWDFIGRDITGIKTQNGRYYSCQWYPDRQCGSEPNGLNCRDIQGNKVLIDQTLKNLNINVDAPKEVYFTPSVTIPGSDFIAGTKIVIAPDTVAKFITALYRFVIGSVGLLAVVGIMIGGFQYLMAAGSPDKISEAKTSITSAIIGLIIALTSYVLLSTINKNLVDFSRGTLALKSVDRVIVDNINANQNSESAGGVGPCPVESDPAFKPVSNSSFGSKNKYFSVVDSPAYLLEPAIGLLTTTIDNKIGGSGPTFGEWLDANKFRIQINSTYRNTKEQMQLKNCYDYKVEGADKCPYNCGSQCALAAPPQCDFGHQSALAIDICLEKMGSISPGNAECGRRCAGNIPNPSSDPMQLAFHQYMASAEWGLLGIEWWHFDHPTLKAKYGGSSGRYRAPGANYQSGCIE